jgi:hypothetical protein
MYGAPDREDFVGVGGDHSSGIDMLFTWDVDGTLSGVVLAVPCPSQVDGNADRFSADYWHDVREELRSRLGDDLGILPLCEAAGDQAPRPIYGEAEREMRERRGQSLRREIALRVSDAVESALECTEPDHGATTVRHAVERTELPSIRITEADREWARSQQASDAGDLGSWWRRDLQDVVESDPGDRGDPVPVEYHALRLGDAALTTCPFELFLDYGVRIKARSPAAQTFPVQLACGRGWYLPTEAARDRGGYGAVSVVADVGPEGGAQLVEETLATTRDHFE